jgi:hypothetical protein
MSRRIHINPWRTDVKPREYTQNKDSHQKYTVDFSSSATDRGTTVSSVTWSSEGTRLVTISNEALASGVASADFTSDWGGFGVVRVRATYADGTQESVYIHIKFKDPEQRS